MSGAEDATDGAYEWTTDKLVACVACGHVVGVGHVHDVTAESAAVTTDHTVAVGRLWRWWDW